MPTRDELFRRVERLVGRLASRRAFVWITAVATLLAATSVGPHRALDDWILGLIATGRGRAVGLDRGVLDLFTFTVGDPANNHRLMDVGVMLPWWTDDKLHIAFFRPLTSLTHLLDERLWPESAVLMHLQSLFWFSVMLLSAAFAYVRLERSAPLVAGLAFLLFALDDAHGTIVAWLSNRNALIAGALGFVVIAAHDVWRRGGRPSAAVAALVAFALGLGAGEIAVGALGYVAAYALFLDSGSPSRRALTVLPYAAVLVVWRLAWARAGYGAHGSGAYLDPIADPVGFLSAAPAKLVMLFHGQFSAPPSDLAFLAPPSHRPLLLSVGTLTVVVVAWLLAPFVRDAMGRFWAAGALLALVPAAATFPSDRLLVFVGLGAMSLLARLFRAFVADGSAGTLALGLRSVITGLLILLHVGLTPLLLPFRSAQMALFALAEERGIAEIPSDAAVRDKTVVVLAAPTVLFANYIQAERELLGIPRPEHLYVLAGASSPIDLERSDANEVTLRPEGGFLYTPLERHYRGDVAAMKPGYVVHLSAMDARVASVGADGRPRAVRFSFTKPAGDYLFVRWMHGRFEPCPLPARGEHLTIPEEDFGRTLLDAVLAL